MKQTNKHPILFSTPMVKAILDGHKTQTRRVVIPRQKEAQGFHIVRDHTKQVVDIQAYDEHESHIGTVHPPYGYTDDLLYVRETWNIFLNDKGPKGYTRIIHFKADGGTIQVPEEYFSWFDKKEERGYLGRPGIHLPKWASRIWIKVKNVRVERLQEIHTEDAVAEGYTNPDFQKLPLQWFADLWDSINEDRGFSWKSNPWVWVIEFEKTEKPEVIS